MKLIFQITVAVLFAGFVVSSQSSAQIGSTAGGTAAGVGTTGQGGTVANQAQDANRDIQFGGESVAIDTEIVGDQRRTSINDANAQGANAFGGAGGNNPFQALFGGGAGGLQGLGSQQGSQQNLKSKIVRAPLVIGFDRPQTSRRSTIQIAQRVSSTFTRLPKFRGDAIVATSVEGKMTLTGTVSSQSQKESAERVARMEPGVRNVENLLTVVEVLVN